MTKTLFVQKQNHTVKSVHIVSIETFDSIKKLEIITRTLLFHGYSNHVSEQLVFENILNFFYDPT